jgi:ABC-type phosphate transport system substrate-binding protein
MKWRIIPALVMAMALCVIAQDRRVTGAEPDGREGVVIVCNGSVKEVSLSRADVQGMFLGRKTRWGDGRKVVPVLLKNSPATDLFLRSYVGKTPQQFTLHWDRLAFTGRGRAPDLFDSPKGLMDFVNRTPGAIGFIPADAYDGKAKSVSIE